LVDEDILLGDARFPQGDPLAVLILLPGADPDIAVHHPCSLLAVRFLCCQYNAAGRRREVRSFPPKRKPARHAAAQRAGSIGHVNRENQGQTVTGPCRRPPPHGLPAPTWSWPPRRRAPG